MQRVFLGWDGPGLPRVVDYLIQRYGSPGRLDLHDVVIAVPGGRAGRRLEELLVEKAPLIDPAWIPPTILTVGRLPEKFYRAKMPFADDFTQQLAWVEAFWRIGEQSSDLLAQVIPNPPSREDLNAWLALAQMIGVLHRELAADDLNFESVADACESIEGFQDKERWRALAAVQKEYLDEILLKENLWDLQTARLFAIRAGECKTDQDILLVGTADLNVSQRRMLDQIGDCATALVFAPESLGDRFDEHGCLRPEAWIHSPIEIPEDRLETSGGPADQADAVVRWIASHEGRYAASELTIGIPDEELSPYIEQRLDECEIVTRYGVGTPISRTGPYRILRAAADFIESGRFASFAALVRLPDASDWIEANAEVGKDWLTRLDEYHADHLPPRWDGARLGASGHCLDLQIVHRAVSDLLEGVSGSEKRSLEGWAPPIAELMIAVFGREPLDPAQPSQREVLSSCERLQAGMESLSGVPAALMPSVTAPDALRLLLRNVESERISAPTDPEAIEMLGWLELALDDAPALVVTSFNEGVTPGSLNADQFLPNQLRRKLGVEDNDRRYARDAYATAMILASRPEVRLIVGRTTVTGDPRMPSRILFACDDETMALRAKRFFDETTDPPRIVLDGAVAPSAEASSLLKRPRPQPLPEPVSSMRVTEFRDYLACPYRYYLRHRLKLKSLDDQALELDGASFGSLAHDVLSRFGASEVKDSISDETIREFLDLALAMASKEKFGRQLRPAVAVQIEQLRGRLHAFASWQAEWASQGWRIECVETAPPEGSAFLDVDNVKMELRGRLDRIDVNLETDERIVFDYKTSDVGNPPERTHQRKGEWIDLQLPLYRRLLEAIEGEVSAARVGYIVLPRDPSKVGAHLAKWDEDELRDADETARDVIRKIWAEEFWPPRMPPPPFSEDFAAICQDERFGPAFGDDEEDS
jgi:ATP-dependent helicase/nuclease subunit B